MKYVRLVVDLPRPLRHPMETFLRESTALERGELIAWNLTAEDVEYALFFFVGVRDRYRDRIERVASVRGYTLTPVDDGSFYAYVESASREADRRWRSAFARRSLVVVPPISYDVDGMTMTVVGDPVDLQSVVEDLPEDIRATIVEVGDYDRRHGTIAAPLTDRQFEAVATAVELGYYEVPRTASLAEVAAALGCAPSTASTHLRKAERAVLGRLVDRHN